MNGNQELMAEGGADVLLRQVLTRLGKAWGEKRGYVRDSRGRFSSTGGGGGGGSGGGQQFVRKGAPGKYDVSVGPPGPYNFPRVIITPRSLPKVSKGYKFRDKRGKKAVWTGQGGGLSR